MRRLFYALALIVVFIAPNISVTATPSPQQEVSAVEQYTAQVRGLMSHPSVVAAFRQIDGDRERILREWIAITEINAPSGREGQRREFIERILRSYRSLEVRTDAAGNLIAVRRGTGGGPTVVIDAHLDTVFQAGLQIRATMRDGRIYAPGIGDDTRNIEAMLATIRALDAANVQTRGDLIFLFTVEEETNFRGVNQFLQDNASRINHFIALDGGYEGFTYGGIGINWRRHHFIGAGGHTRSRTPPASATLPLARTISRIYELPVPDDPPSWLNIGMLGGAEVVNAKAADAWFTVDLRSTSDEVMADLERRIAAILREEAERAGMTVRTEVISTEGAAQLPGHRESYLVRMAEAIHLALGFERPPITATASNHASAALRARVSAISTGTAPCGDSHALTEWCEVEPFYRGIKKVLLLELALAQMSGR